MNLSGLKEYFLEAMGITRFELRHNTACEYLLLLSPAEAKPNKSMRALIERLIDAVDWPHQTTQKIGFDKGITKEIIKEKVGAAQPKKIIMFGTEFAEYLGLKPKEQIHMLKLEDKSVPCAIVSSLNSLLEDKAAKRRTWELLQRL